MKKRIYLSGGFYGAYKDTVFAALGPQFNLDDPETLPREPLGPHHPRIPGVYVGQDFSSIRDANLVLAVQTDYPYLYGMAAEVGYAVANEVDVIYVCLTKRVDGFLAGCSRAVFTDLEAACQFIKERYK